MSGELLLFYVVAALMVATALSMVMARDLVHGVLFMVGNFVLTAIVYLLLQAPFIAAVQLAVYAGAIMVLFLFVVMLLGALLVFVTGEGVPAAPPAGLAEGALAQAQTADGAWLGADALAALPAAERAALDDLGGFGSPQMVGEALYTDAYHLLPFELVSLLLLVAMLGAVVIAHYPARPGAEAGEESAT